MATVSVAMAMHKLAPIYIFSYNFTIINVCGIIHYSMFSVLSYVIRERSVYIIMPKIDCPKAVARPR